MRALKFLTFCTFTYASSWDIFIDVPVLLLDCRAHDSESPLDNTAKFDSTEEPGEGTTNRYITEEPIDLKELYDAARDGDLSFINGAIARLSSSGLDLNWRNSYHHGDTALHIATKKNHTSIIGALLDAGADLDVLNFDELTPVFVAAWEGSTGALELLLARGADPNKLGNDGTWGRTSPLQGASYKGHVEAVRMLIQAGAHVDYVYPGYGYTALHYAARFYHPDVALLLLQNGADKNKQDEDGNTPADLARREGHDSVAQLIDNY